MLTLAPLPTWANLFRAFLWRTAVSDDNLAAPWRRDNEVTGWLSRSAWSLALIALWRKKFSSAPSITVWIPDFFCNASLTALRQTGAKLVFYPLNNKMEPDIVACRELEGNAKPDIFVLVHYFGKPTPAAATRDFCARHGAWLVEDAAHVLRPVTGVGEYGDFILYSPHKHLAIPDGAVLVLGPHGPSKFTSTHFEFFGHPHTWPSQLDELQKRMGISPRANRKFTTVWLVKRVLQKLGISRWRRSMIAFTEPLTPNHTTSAQLGSPSLSNMARRLLTGLYSDIESVARCRQRNQLLWDELLVKNENAVSVAERPVGREWTPYLAAYQLDSATAEQTYMSWQQRGLPVTTWPDLPPEVTKQRELHAYAWQLRHGFFYLPVHQSLSTQNFLKNCSCPKIVPCIRLVWDQITQEQWEQGLTQMGRSNLLQSWCYGEAKAEKGWWARRGIFFRNNEPIAFVQVLQKRFLGLLNISRINRGPLFLKPLDSDELQTVWSELARLGNIWRGRFLTVAFELGLSGSSLIMMGKAGFRQFSPRAWESVWIDLGLELNVLRKQLNGKWRNMLVFSEKALLKLEVGSDDQLFDWMMTQYQELMQEKNFTGTPIDLIQSLRKHMKPKQPLVVLRAIHEGESVAGICLVRHGVAATYLVGWNGAKGRHLKANQYLLWNAISYLKQTGSRWLDLGGISEELTPGITAFKLGLNGERYELVGEYWKW